MNACKNKVSQLTSVNAEKLVESCNALSLEEMPSLTSACLDIHVKKHHGVFIHGGKHHFGSVKGGGMEKKKLPTASRGLANVSALALAS